jgi:hypothetical protein
MSADAFEDIAQVSEGIETQLFGGGDQPAQHGGGPATIVAAIERPIAATDSDATQAALGPYFDFIIRFDDSGALAICTSQLDLASLNFDVVAPKPAAQK